MINNDVDLKILVEKAKNGDDDAFQSLLEEFMPLIKKCSKISYYNQEDCKQYLIILFWKSLSKIKLE